MWQQSMPSFKLSVAEDKMVSDGPSLPVSAMNQHAHQSNLPACLSISHWHCLANKASE